MLYSGKGVAADLDTAIVYYERAAQCGEAAALNALGLLLEEGKGLEYNPKLASEFYRRAAEMVGNVLLPLEPGKGRSDVVLLHQGNGDGAFNLGVLLSRPAEYRTLRALRAGSVNQEPDPENEVAGETPASLACASHGTFSMPWTLVHRGSRGGCPVSGGGSQPRAPPCLVRADPLEAADQAPAHHVAGHPGHGADARPPRDLQVLLRRSPRACGRFIGVLVGLCGLSCSSANLLSHVATSCHALLARQTTTRRRRTNTQAASKRRPCSHNAYLLALSSSPPRRRAPGPAATATSRSSKRANKAVQACVCSFRGRCSDAATSGGRAASGAGAGAAARQPAASCLFCSVFSQRLLGGVSVSA
jgi:hypothetical protein